ncbi:hypothetical protein A0H81_04978 [Grifola frondosa]|uniref:Uncharacterized protein n=1 Tax=Grifola frondosa TaxID=5627 RepID=A0A1C7MER3_GRIFR|nr:hypothetical protein A0H81_04978 [Grifola frondosa]
MKFEEDSVVLGFLQCLTFKGFDTFFLNIWPYILRDLYGGSMRTRSSKFLPSSTVPSEVRSILRMSTNWQDPSVVIRNYVSFGTLAQVTGGIFLWEWVTTLYFDWRLLSVGRANWRWPTLIYVISRLSLLVTVICKFITFNVKNEVNCNALARIVIAFGYFAMVLSSLLIALRMNVIAIWNWKLPITFFVIITALVNTVFLFYGLIYDRGSIWNPIAGACVMLKTDRNRLSIFVAFGTDVLMLIVMLIGIWVHRGTGSLWKLVQHRGLIWFAVAVLSYIPNVVCMLSTSFPEA